MTRRCEAARRHMGKILGAVRSSRGFLMELPAQIAARRRLQAYLSDPSIGVPYDELRRRMVADGISSLAGDPT